MSNRYVVHLDCLGNRHEFDLHNLTFEDTSKLRDIGRADGEYERQLDRGESLPDKWLVNHLSKISEGGG